MRIPLISSVHTLTVETTGIGDSLSGRNHDALGPSRPGPPGLNASPFL